MDSASDDSEHPFLPYKGPGRHPVLGDCCCYVHEGAFSPSQHRAALPDPPRSLPSHSAPFLTIVVY